ncbi:DUF1295 domain-containing protein [Verrucomicrobiaceae bacterium 227]
MNDLILLTVVAALVILDFIAGWWFGTKIKNYSLVDALWAAWIGLAGILYAILGSGDVPKRIAAGALAAIWGGRLAYHLQKRIRKHHPEEDSRYQKLREIWQGRETRSFFWFFQAQAISVLLLALPYFLIARDASPWGLFETLGLTVALIGITGEILADHQMSQFKKHDNRSTSVCQDGLWNYSRHPNYFFEMVIWIGLFLFACGSAYGWTTFYAPAVITFLLLKVTGIPPTEASAVKRKGDAYRDYQDTTSAFIPLPKKSS